MKKIGLILVLGLLITSCGVNKSMSTAKTMDIYGSGVIHIPVVADLEVSPTKVSATMNFSGDLMLITKANEQEVIAKAIKKVGADILIEPSFEKKQDGSEIIVTVTGFPAKYKNFRNAKSSDIELLKVGNGQI